MGQCGRDRASIFGDRPGSDRPHRADVLFWPRRIVFVATIQIYRLHRMAGDRTAIRWQADGAQKDLRLASMVMAFCLNDERKLVAEGLLT